MPRTNSGSVMRPRRPSSPPFFAGSLNHSKPPRFGLMRIGVSFGRLRDHRLAEALAELARRAALQHRDRGPIGR